MTLYTPFDVSASAPVIEPPDGLHATVVPLWREAMAAARQWKITADSCRPLSGRRLEAQTQCRRWLGIATKLEHVSSGAERYNKAGAY